MDIGESIVCVKNFGDIDVAGNQVPFKTPKRGEVYSYDGYKHCFKGVHYIFLKEYAGRSIFNRPSFNKDHFRRLRDVGRELTNELVNELENEIMEEQYERVEAL